MTIPSQTFLESLLKYPWSGDVTQAIAPYTNWFSPQITVNAGDARLEGRILTDAASYGRQLGVVLDVLAELTKGRKKTEATEALDRLIEKIDAVKEQHRGNLAEQAEESLKRLWQDNPEMAEAVIESVRVRMKRTE